MQLESLLQNLENEVLGHIAGRHDGHCFVKFRIERLARGVDDLQAVILHQLGQHLQREFLALAQGLDGRRLASRIQSALHAVTDLQQIFHDAFQRELARLLGVAQHPFAQIFHLRLHAQHRLAVPGQFTLHLLEFILKGGPGRRRTCFRPGVPVVVLVIRLIFELGSFRERTRVVVLHVDPILPAAVRLAIRCRFQCLSYPQYGAPVHRFKRISCMRRIAERIAAC